MQKAANREEGRGLGMNGSGVRLLSQGRCHANVSHNWERNGSALRFLESFSAKFLPMVQKTMEFMFGMEIALEADVREGRFLSKHAVRASGNGA
jgi:hypothetical protein